MKHKFNFIYNLTGDTSVELLFVLSAKPPTLSSTNTYRTNIWSCCISLSYLCVCSSWKHLKCHGCKATIKSWSNIHLGYKQLHFASVFSGSVWLVINRPVKTYSRSLNIFLLAMVTMWIFLKWYLLNKLSLQKQMLKCPLAILNSNYLLLSSLFFRCLWWGLCCLLWEECGHWFPVALYSFPMPPSSCIPTDSATETLLCQQNYHTTVSSLTSTSTSQHFPTKTNVLNLFLIVLDRFEIIFQGGTFAFKAWFKLTKYVSVSFVRLSFLPNRSYSDNGRTILANEQESQDSLGPLWGCLHRAVWGTFEMVLVLNSHCKLIWPVNEDYLDIQLWSSIILDFATCVMMLSGVIQRLEPSDKCWKANRTPSDSEWEREWCVIVLN